VAAKNEPGKESSELDFVITREFEAPRPLVFQAWTDPRQLAQWWGPHGFQNRCEVDARPGGAYRIVMRSADGVEFPMTGVYRELIAPERIVYTSDLSEHPVAWHDLVNPKRDRKAPRPALESVTTVTFEEHAGKTRVTVRTRFESAEVRDALVKIGMTDGWSQSLERFAAVVGTGTADREIVATRVFEAPRELVWKAWTEPKHIAQWWGPNGFKNTISHMEVKPGGVWEFVMHGPDGVDYQNKIVYGEVVEPVRLTYDHVNDPFFHATVSFIELGGRTMLTVRMIFATAEEREKVAKFGAVEGLHQTLARLHELLPRLRG
jgi:uncharacterized protein YndB with AHSA1/START domain